MSEQNKRRSTLAKDRTRAVLIGHALVAGVLLFTLALAPIAARAQAQAKNGLSVGPIMADPTGVTLRGGLDERNAIPAHPRVTGDAVNNDAAWFTGRDQLQEYDRHHDVPHQSNLGLGMRGGAVGVRTSFVMGPFDLFFDLAPVGGTFIVPNPVTYYDIDLALGARLRF